MRPLRLAHYHSIVQPYGCRGSYLGGSVIQWFSQKSGGDSAVRSEFVIAGMIFHHRRVQSELLHKYIEQSLVELTLFPPCHREDVWCLTLLHTQVRSAHEIERCQ